MRPAAWLAAGLLLASCTGTPSVTDVEVSTSAAPVSTSTPPSAGSDEDGPDIPGVLAGFPIQTVFLANEPLLVAVADTAGRRHQGLMDVEDLGVLDGMLFAYESEVRRFFVMRNTLIPLDILFFDADGVLVATRHMVPCDREPCPLYSAPVAFRWALEVPAGSRPGVRSGDQLSIP